MYKSPNGTIRNNLGGTVFREPIIISNIPSMFCSFAFFSLIYICILGVVSHWKYPIIVGRHAFADQYAALEAKIPAEKGTLSLMWTPENSSQPTELRSVKFPLNGSSDVGGVTLAMYNLDESIRNFAKACCSLAVERKMPLYFTTKNTILKLYDGKFR